MVDELRDSEPPFFFLRLYREWPGEPLRIYGRKVQMSNAEDRASVADAERRGWIFTESFSVVEPHGEYGSQPLSELQEISRSEFEQARERDWA